jgi:hypothetical protein
MGVLPLTSSCDQLVARLSLRSSGGRLAEFEAAYPELRRQALTRRTLQPDHDPDAERRARSYRTRL